MRLYETAFLIAPTLAEDETEQLIQQMAEVITQKKGKMINIDKWGKRKTAYQIQKFDAASYVFFLYEGEAEIPAELERRFKQTESVIRYLTVKMEHEVKHRRRKSPRAKPKEPVEKKGDVKEESGEPPAPEPPKDDDTAPPPAPQEEEAGGAKKEEK
jgi:small subunit ribosomal protein S6